MKKESSARICGYLLCVLAIILIGRALVSRSEEAQQRSEVAVSDWTTHIPKKEWVAEIEVKPKAETLRPRPEVSVANRSPSERSTHTVLNPDEEFMKRVDSLSIDRATLEARLEVGRRIKASEKGRAKLILSEKKNGKETIAYAVKQPTMTEIASITKPFNLLMDKQVSQADKAYVDKAYKNIFDHYGLTDGRYRLLYAVIPTESGLPVRQCSYAAADEQECLEILRQELAPKPPIVVGVTYSSRQGQSSYANEILPGSWRMDHLVSEDLIRPFYNNARSAQLSRADDGPVNK